MIYVLTGNGKGKTTCAIGMGTRAAGAEKKVLMIQFLKAPGFSSENKVIKKIKNFEVKSFGRKGFIVSKSYLKSHPELKKMGLKQATKEDFELMKKGVDLAKIAVDSKNYALLILAEICLALKFNLVAIEFFLNFLKEASQKLDIVLTGRQCPKQIIKVADLVTEFREKKHYFKKGKKARKGIEY